MQKRAIVVAYKIFNCDPRIIREINSLLDNGYVVDHICVKPNNEYQIAQLHPNLKLYWIHMKRKRGSLLRYLYEYLVFFSFSFITITRLALFKKFTFLLIFTMPESLVFCGLVAKIFGIKILMDWEDPTYELYITKFEKINRFLLFAIKIIEALSVKFSDRIITPNCTFKDAFVKRGASADSIDIVLNAPDLRVFNRPIDGTSEDANPFSVLFNGSVFHRHGLDIGIKAINLIRKKIPQIQLTIIGEGENAYEKYCKQLICEYGLTDNIVWLNAISIDKMPLIYHKHAVVIIPNRENPFTSINFPQRIFECGIMGRPVVVSRLPGIEAYMPESCVQYVTPDNPTALSDGLFEILIDRKKYQNIVQAAYEKCKMISWEQEFHKSIQLMINGCIQPL
jgi:glycosyltransferase involved in cell wall biosynthesis